MKLFDKLGQLLIKATLDAQKERAGESILFVIDLESKGLQEKILKRLEGIEKELKKINS